jgi:hypothetical protein
MTEALRPCKNELCDGLLAGSALYCCEPCWLADERHYEIHEDGPLGHAPECRGQERRNQRA